MNNYSLRKNTLSKKQIAAMSKWANAQPKADEKNQISQQSRNLWDALHEFIRKDAGAIVSVKYAWPIRLETAPDSELPAKLRDLGYDLVFCEQATRIGAPIVEPVLWGQRSRKNDAYSFRTVDVYSVTLPK